MQFVAVDYRIGRLPTMIVCQLCMIGVGVGCSFSPNLPSYVVLRFALAILVQASYLSCFVYGAYRKINKIQGIM